MDDLERLESDRLIYSKITRNDLEFFTAYLSDPVLTRYLPQGEPYTEKEITGYLKSRIDHWNSYQFGLYLLSLKSTQEYIGYCGLENVGETGFIDIRYGVIQKHWGKGLAKEAAVRVLDIGFKELGLETIYGVAVPENIASAEILKRIGMTACFDTDFYKAEVDYYCLKKSYYQNQIT